MVCKLFWGWWFFFVLLKNVILIVKEIWIMLVMGNFGVSYLCRYVWVVVMVFSDYVLCGWNKGGVCVYVFKGGSKFWIVYGFDVIVIKVII